MLGIVDLFVIGLGLDVAGAFLIARGLLSSPSVIARRSGTYFGRNYHDLLAQLGARADTVLGLGWLALGFTVQVGGYVLAAWVGSEDEPSAGRGLLALALGATACVLALAVSHWKVQPLLVRRYVRDAARFPVGRDIAERHPVLVELLRLAQVAEADGRPGFGRLAGEGDREYVCRVWGVTDVVERSEGGDVEPSSR